MSESAAPRTPSTGRRSSDSARLAALHVKLFTNREPVVDRQQEPSPP